MRFSNKKSLLVFLILLSSTIYIVPDWWAFRPILAFLNIFYLPGFIFTMLVLGNRSADTDYIFFPLLISPILISFLIVGLFKIIHSHLLLSYLSFAIVYISGFLVALLKDNKADESKITMPFPVIIISIAFGALIAGLYILNPFLKVRSDSWYHASVVVQTHQFHHSISKGCPEDYSVCCVFVKAPDLWSWIMVRRGGIPPFLCQ